MQEDIFFGSKPCGFAIANILRQFSLMTSHNFSTSRKFIFLSFFEEKRFVYLQKGSLSQGQLEFFCWQMYSKWEEKYFYSLAYDRMRLLKNFLDVSISLPSKNSNATDWSLCECLQNGRTLFSFISKTFSTTVPFSLVARSFVFHWALCRKGPQTLSIL